MKIIVTGDQGPAWVFLYPRIENKAPAGLQKKQGNFIWSRTVVWIRRDTLSRLTAGHRTEDIERPWAVA